MDVLCFYFLYSDILYYILQLFTLYVCELFVYHERQLKQKRKTELNASLNAAFNITTKIETLTNCNLGAGRLIANSSLLVPKRKI